MDAGLAFTGDTLPLVAPAPVRWQTRAAGNGNSLYTLKKGPSLTNNEQGLPGPTHPRSYSPHVDCCLAIC